jgi:phosphate transport system protein
MKLTKSIKEKHELISKFNIADIVREVEVITIKTNECFQNMDETSIEEIQIKQILKVKAAMQSIISLVK